MGKGNGKERGGGGERRCVHTHTGTSQHTCTLPTHPYKHTHTTLHTTHTDTYTHIHTLYTQYTHTTHTHTYTHYTHNTHTLHTHTHTHTIHTIHTHYTHTHIHTDTYTHIHTLYTQYTHTTHLFSSICILDIMISDMLWEYVGQQELVDLLQRLLVFSLLLSLHSIEVKGQQPIPIPT